MLAPNTQVPFDDPSIDYTDGMFVSCKYDGNRCLVRGHQCLTRHMLIQANTKLPVFLKELCELSEKTGYYFDCELVLPKAEHHGDHTSIFNSHEKDIPKDTMVYVFDCIHKDQWAEKSPIPEFIDRYGKLTSLMRGLPERFKCVKQYLCFNPKTIEEIYKKYILVGQEGVMVRSTHGGYKFGRVGIKNSWLLKFKKQVTEDGKIINVLQKLKMKKGIVRTRDITGHRVQPTKNKENYTTTNSVGSFLVQTDDGKKSKIMFASGVADEATKKKWWKDFKENPKNFIGKYVEFVSYPGGKDGIRSGRMIRWRPDKDKNEK